VKVGFVASAGMVVALLGAATSPALPVARAGEVVSSVFEAGEAKALASAQGVRVEVLSQRSETDQVFANPDGSLTREQYLEPVRVREGQTWLDVDSALEKKSDGSWGPRVSAVEMSFSPGGASPAVTMDLNNVRLELTWPTALPAPTVDGNAVTYPEVFPGVDLQLAAEGTSFTQHLLVKTRAAGLDPRVRSFVMKARVKGGSLVQDATGYAVKDSRGRDVLTGAQPVMWDSKVRPAGATGDALAEAIVRLDEGDRQAPMGLTVAKDAVTIRPNTTLLDNPNAVYPVVLDPTTSPSIYNWAMVNATYPSVSYYKFTDADQGVGYNDFESPANKKRIFLSFPTSAYNGKKILSATLRAFETYSASCAAGSVNAYLSGDISSGVTWNSQPGKLIASALDSWSTKAGRSDCYPGGKTADWNVTAGVVKRTGDKASRSTFVLQGASESNYSSWMRFGGPSNGTASKRPSLSVTYNTPPTKPTKAAMWAPSLSTPCSTSAPGPSINPAAGASEYMYVKISDPDGDNVTSTIRVFRASDDAIAASTNFTARASGSTVSMLIPSSLVDATTYYFRGAVSDAYPGLGFGDKCYFTVDKVGAPTPTITSTTWKENVLAPADATSGSFTMTSPGATKMLYRWIDGATPLSSSTTNGSVTYTATTSRSLHEWRATAEDAAGTRGGTAGFFVKRTQPGKLAEYLFNGPVPNSEGVGAVDCSSGNMGAPCDTANSQLEPTAGSDSDTPLADPDAAAAYKFDFPSDQSNFSQGGRWSDAVDNHALVFDGSPSTVASLPSRPVVNTESFVIGGWSLLSDRAQSRTLLALQRDETASNPSTPALALDLGYDQPLDRFVLRVMRPDGTVLAQAIDALPDLNAAGEPLDRSGSWTYLVLVYDKTAGHLRLDAFSTALQDPIDSDFAQYIEGDAVTVSGAIAGGLGEFMVGGGTSANGNRAAWAGLLDNMAVWQGIPTEERILANVNNRR
jgi:hypothetical protein